MNILPLLRTAAAGITGLMGLGRGFAGGPDGVTGTPPERPKSARRFTRWAAWVLYAALMYHFLLWPVLNFHFPHYGFPPIDAGLLSALAGLGF